MVKTVEEDQPDRLQRSQENAAHMRRIAPAGSVAGVAAMAARKADKARWQAPVADAVPKDRRTREYREWAAKQPT